MAHIPTPLHRLDRISDNWGSEIWIKRDDMTGSGLSGNKVRKLEYLVANAISQGADTLITCGGVQSNHSRATALAAAQQGLSCYLLLRGTPPKILDGNLLIDRLTGAEIEYISEECYNTNIDWELDRIAQEIKATGKVPYVIPEGGSNAIGAMGYVQAAREAQDQCERMGFQPRVIVCATGSGATHAGLWVGSQINGWDVQIISITVGYDAEKAKRLIEGLVDSLWKHLGPSRFPGNDKALSYKPNDIVVLDDYRGIGYALADDLVFEVIAEMAQLEGILLDPVYTGKAARGTKLELAAGHLTGPVLFWHTGGVFGLFPFREDIDSFFK